MERIQILWADDEIDLLKPHLLFLKDKGYDVITATSGDEALELADKNDFAVVLLDENMPGISGLETLTRLKSKHSDIPVIMITKSEEEHLMEDAIGSKISDYLIKPVNPNQILLSLKKTLDKNRLISEKTNSGYAQQFRQIGMTMSDRLTWAEWAELYRKLVYWELELDKSNDEGMSEMLQTQKVEANKIFCKFFENNYIGWLKGKGTNAPLFSHNLINEKVLPLLEKPEPVFLILIDNLRFDQWRIIQPFIAEYFKIEAEEMYSCILPSVTHYARNAMFAGLMPSEIQKRYPQYWVSEGSEEGRNEHEAQLLAEQLKRLGKDVKMGYKKVTQNHLGKKLVDNMNNLMQNKLNVIVYNFVDILSHSRTEMEFVRELTSDGKAYRSITSSWFNNSPLLEMIKYIASKKGRMVITTDHGSIQVKQPSTFSGPKELNANLRYKTGRGMSMESRDVFFIKNPSDAFLPEDSMGYNFAFAKEDNYLVYQNGYNKIVSIYKNSFQHGGLSMEETMVPVITLSAK